MAEDIEKLAKIVEIINNTEIDEKEPDMLVHFIFDRSGSMASLVDTVIDGFNETIQGLRGTHTEKKILVSLTQFDHTVELIHSGERLDKIPVLTRKVYSARGNTALNDAVGQTILEIDRQIAQYNERPTILVFVFTDGYENASKEYTRESVKKLIEEREKGGWNITYLGAVPDAWAQGGSIGFSSGKSYHLSGGITRGVFTGVADIVSGVSVLDKGYKYDNLVALDSDIRCCTGSMSDRNSRMYSAGATTSV